MWRNELESNYSNSMKSKRLLVTGRTKRSAFGGRSEIPSPNYGATAPVMPNPHPCQLSSSRLPLKMVVSDVVHRDFGPLQQSSPTESHFIVTPKKGSGPYDYYKNVVRRHSHTSRNHPIVEEIQKKFNAIYGHQFQNATSCTGTPCPSTSVGQGSPMEANSIEQGSSIPKFSNFYKDYLLKQQSASDELKISDSDLYFNNDKNTSDENENDKSKKDNINKGQEHFLAAKNFLHTIEEKHPGCKEEDDSSSQYSKNKSEVEYSSSSSQEYCSQSDNFCFRPVSEEKKDGFIHSRSKIVPQTWTPKYNPATADSKHSVGGKTYDLCESSVSDTSDEDTTVWFTNEDPDEDLN